MLNYQIQGAVAGNFTMPKLNANDKVMFSAEFCDLAESLDRYVVECDRRIP